jgi:hypothetical protein
VASKILGEAPQALFLAQDLKRTLAGSSFDVRFFEHCYPKHSNSSVASTRLVDTVNLVCANHTTYYLAVTNFGDYSSFEYMPWYVATAACIGGSYDFSRSLPVCLCCHAQLSWNS